MARPRFFTSRVYAFGFCISSSAAISLSRGLGGCRRDLGRIRLRAQSIVKAEDDEGDDNSRQTEGEYVTDIVSRDTSAGPRFGDIEQSILVILWHCGVHSSRGIFVSRSPQIRCLRSNVGREFNREVRIRERAQ